MSLFKRFRIRTDKPQVADREALVSRYQHLRLVAKHLNSKLIKQLSKDVINEGGRKLGILKGNAMVFDSEGETAVLMDYCIYDVRRDDRNAFEEYLVSCSAEAESDELVCLRAMQSATYSIFVVETVEPELGITVQDMRTNETHLVVDKGFSICGKPGMMFASRLLFHDGFAMTGGAALPMGYMPSARSDAFNRSIFAILEPDDEGYFDPAPLIRSCRTHGASSRVQYLEPVEPGGGQQPLTAKERRAQAEPYEPCPCGSGKKFKFCCLKRR